MIGIELGGSDEEDDLPDEGENSELFGRLKRLNTIDEESSEANTTDKDRGSLAKMDSKDERLNGPPK